MRKPVPLGHFTVRLNELAARPCGTNTYDCVAHLGGTNDHASELLKARHRNGHLFRIVGDGWRLHQYFLSEEHARAWTGQNASYRQRCDAVLISSRPTAPMKKVHRPAKHSPLDQLNWRRAPLTGSPIAQVLPKPSVMVSVGLSAGYDPHFQMSPQAAAEFEGEFSKEWKRLRGEV